MAGELQDSMPKHGTLQKEQTGRLKLQEIILLSLSLLGEGEGGLTRLQVEVVGQAQHQHVWP